MKKLYVLAGVLLLLFTLSACRPIIGNPYTVTAALSLSAKADWQAQTGPTYGSNNLNADYASVVANPSTYGYTVLTGKVTVTSTSNNSLNHAIVNGCIEVAPGTSTVFIYDLFVVAGYSGDCAGFETSAIKVPNNAVNDVGFMDVEIFPSPSHPQPWMAHGIVGGDYTCTRCDIHGFNKSIYAGGDDILFVDSMAYDAQAEPVTSNGRHADALFVQGSTNVQVKHSWIDGSIPSGYCCSTGSFTAGTTANLLVTDSYIMTGYGTGAGMGFNHGNVASTNAVITNNVFGTWSHATSIFPSGSTFTWSGNTWEPGDPNLSGPCTYGVFPCTP